MLLAIFDSSCVQSLAIAAAEGVKNRFLDKNVEGL